MSVTQDSAGDTVMRSVSMLCAVVVCGAVIGGVFYLASQLIYIPLVFPVLTALLGMLALQSLSAMFKPRQRRFVLLCGLLMGLSIYASLQTGIYLHLRQLLVQRVMALAAGQNRTLTYSQADAYLEGVLIQQTGQSGFLGVLVLRARSGIGITLYSTQLGGMPIQTNLQGILAYGYWLAELGLILFVCSRPKAVSRAMPRAPKNLCPVCHSKLTRESLGSVPEVKAEQFLTLLNTHDFRAAGRFIVSHDLGEVRYPRLDTELEHCTKCGQGPSTLRVFWERDQKTPVDLRTQAAEYVIAPDDKTPLLKALVGAQSNIG